MIMQAAEGLDSCGAAARVQLVTYRGSISSHANDMGRDRPVFNLTP